MKASKFIFVGLFLLLAIPSASKAATTDNLSGYAWSSNVGWVSLNCTNDNTCATNNYGVTVASNGTMTGYAWSPNVGWISFNSADTTGCPSGTCQATVTTSTGVTSGWARAVAGEDTNPLDTGNWGGWIQLTGTNYGVTYSNCKWSGYAWGGGPDLGSGVIGWLQFSGTTGGNQSFGVVGGSGCAPSVPPLSATCSVSPTSAVTNQTTTWTAVPTGGTAPYTYAWGGSVSGTSNPQTMSFPSAGSYSGQVTVTSTDGQHATAQCSPGGTANPIVVQSCIPGFSANPTSVVTGQQSTLTWAESGSCATSCTGSGFSTSGALSGSTTVTPPTSPNSNYSLTCGVAANTSNISIAVTVPSVSITPSESLVSSGSSAVLSWTSSSVTSCSITRNGNSWSQGNTTSGTNVTDSTPVTGQTIYVITCQTAGSPVTAQTTVNIAPQFNTF